MTCRSVHPNTAKCITTSSRIMTSFLLGTHCTMAPRGMLSSAHVLAMDAKNLLDVLDSIRLNFPLVDRFVAPTPRPPPPPYPQAGDEGGEQPAGAALPHHPQPQLRLGFFGLGLLLRRLLPGEAEGGQGGPPRRPPQPPPRPAGREGAPAGHLGAAQHQPWCTGPVLLSL